MVSRNTPHPSTPILPYPTLPCSHPQKLNMKPRPCTRTPERQRLLLRTELKIMTPAPSKPSTPQLLSCPTLPCSHPQKPQQSCTPTACKLCTPTSNKVCTPTSDKQRLMLRTWRASNLILPNTMCTIYVKSRALNPLNPAPHPLTNSG